MSDLPAYEKLLNGTFPVQPERSFFDDFPIWDPRLPLGRRACFGIWEGAGLLASGGVVLRIIRTSEGSLPCALIGSVATRPESQGRGLASELTKFLLDWARENGAELAALWGSEHSLYGKLGFSLRGKQCRARIGDILSSGKTAATVDIGWNPALAALLSNRQTGLEWDAQTIDLVSRVKGTEWFWSGPREMPTACVGFGRGIDLQGIIHEWGGQREAIRSLLVSLALEIPDAQILFHPSHAVANWFSREHLISEGLALIHPLEKERSSVFWDSLWFWGLDSA